VIPLFGGARPTSEVTAGHTFYMEELGVKAGDSVSYLRARDRQRRDQRREADEQRHLFPAHPPVRQELQAGASMAGVAVAAWRRRDRKSARCRSSSGRSFRHVQLQRDRKTSRPRKFREGRWSC
jgi:hypothetical protein